MQAAGQQSRPAKERMILRRRASDPATGVAGDPILAREYVQEGDTPREDRAAASHVQHVPNLAADTTC